MSYETMDETSTTDASKLSEQSPGEECCPECGNSAVSNHNTAGERVCADCGFVLAEAHVDDVPEWRAFSQEERETKARAGEPLTYTRHDMGVSTEVGAGSGELSTVPGKKRAQYARIQQWHSRRTGAKDRNLGFAFSELKRLASQLHLPEAVQEEVARLYGKAVEDDLVKGRSMEGVLTAVIYAVARKQGVPRTLDEIAEASGLEEREIGRTYRYVARELGLDIRPAKPEEYLSRFTSELDVSGRVQERARRLIERARDESLLAGKGRTGIVGAAVYIAAMLEQEKRTQPEVADVVGVTEVTLRNRYQELVAELGLALETG